VSGDASAGWYVPDADQPHRLRYWDGTRWTEHTVGTETPGAARPGVEPLEASVPVARLVRAVEARLGGLTGDEFAQLHGAAEAAAVGQADPDTARVPARRAEELADLCGAGRRGACLFCGAALSEHTVAVSPDEVVVWCPGSDDPRSAADWLDGPARHSTGSVIGAALLWVGVPGLSAGLLSWVPSLVAGLRHGRRSWLVAATAIGALTAVMIALIGGEGAASSGELSVASWLVVALWLGPMVYGGLQVRPYLACRPASSRKAARMPRPADRVPPQPGRAVRAGPGDPAAAQRGAGSAGTGGAASGAPAHPRPRPGPAARPWLDRVRAEVRRRRHEKALRAWQAEQDLRTYAVWCAETMVAGRNAPGPDPSPIALRSGEVLLWSGSGQLIEPRRAPGQYRGGSAGFSVPVAFGVRARVGSHRGTYQPGAELQTPVDAGTVVVTSTRVVFAGGMKTREWQMARIVQVQQSNDGRVTLLPVSNRQTVSGVIIRVDQNRFGIALDVAASVAQDSPPEVLAGLRLHQELHRDQCPNPPEPVHSH
jgi:hypothetical protein